MNDMKEDSRQSFLNGLCLCVAGNVPPLLSAL